MGDIMEVRARLPSSVNHTDQSNEMLRVPESEKANFPARLTISGRIDEVRVSMLSFTVTICQRIRGAGPRAHLKIAATMRPRALRPAKLPPPSSVATVTGRLLSFEHAVAEMAVDDIAYMPRAPLTPLARMAFRFASEMAAV